MSKSKTTNKKAQEKPKASKNQADPPQPPQQDSEKKEDDNKVGFPMVAPTGRMERNMPKPPHVLRVCGNNIKVRNGKAEEGNPKKIREIQREQLRQRGKKPDTTYI